MLIFSQFQYRNSKCVVIKSIFKGKVNLYILFWGCTFPCCVENEDLYPKLTVLPAESFPNFRFNDATFPNLARILFPNEPGKGLVVYCFNNKQQRPS